MKTRKQAPITAPALCARARLTPEWMSQITPPNAVRESLRLVTGDRDLNASAAEGFSDCLIAQLNGEAGCGQTITLDRGAARIAGFELLPWSGST